MTWTVELRQAWRLALRMMRLRWVSSASVAASVALATCFAMHIMLDEARLSRQLHQLFGLDEEELAVEPVQPPAGEPELDAELSAALRALDPATDDATYWLRFRAWVVESAAPELARRRLAAGVTRPSAANTRCSASMAVMSGSKPDSRAAFSSAATA